MARRPRGRIISVLQDFATIYVYNDRENYIISMIVFFFRLHIPLTHPRTDGTAPRRHRDGRRFEKNIFVKYEECIYLNPNPPFPAPESVISLPPLDCLRFFESAARLCSFAHARAHRPRPARGLRGPAPARRGPLPLLALACLPRPPSRARSEAPAAHLRPALLPHRTRRPALRRGPRAGAPVRADRARHRARTTRRIEPAGPGGPRTVTQCRATLGRRSCARRGPVGQRSCVVRRIRGP